MRNRSLPPLFLALISLSVALLPPPVSAQRSTFEPWIGAKLSALTAGLTPAVGAQTTCVIHTMECDQTVNSTLASTDCDLGDGNFVDFWSFDGSNGDRVTINGSSTDFDPLLALLDPTPVLVTTDDDSGPGLNSRIVWDLDVSGEWTIGIGNVIPNELGNYQLSLGCRAAQPPVEPFDCMPDATTLCLAGDRFQVKANWRTNQGTSGSGRAVELTPDTGYFWFFNESNVEMVIKVLNACNFADHFWVFAGGLTNVEVTLTVTDSDTGNVKTYNNPLNTSFQPIQDTEAFATCP